MSLNNTTCGLDYSSDIRLKSFNEIAGDGMCCDGDASKDSDGDASKDSDGDDKRTDRDDKRVDEDDGSQTNLMN